MVGPLSNKISVLIKRNARDPLFLSTHILRKTHVRTQNKVVCKPEREFSSETKVLLSDKRENKLYNKNYLTKREVKKEEQRTRMQVRQTKDK